MGSKRSSKNPNKVPSVPPPASPPGVDIHKTPKNSNTSTVLSPSKSIKKQKRSIRMSPEKISPSHIPSTDGETAFQNGNHKDKAPSNTNKISPCDGSATRPVVHRWGAAENLKFLEALAAFRSKKGSVPTISHMAELLEEIKDWAPHLSVKNLDSKIRHLRLKFQKSAKPGPESSEFDRSFHEIGSQVWGPASKVKGSAAGPLDEDNLNENGDEYNLNENGMPEKGDNMKGKNEKTSEKLNVVKQYVVEKKEDDGGVEDEESDGEDDEGSDGKAEKSMEVENGQEHEKEDLLVGEVTDLLDRDVAGYPYKYLKLALEEYWKEAKLNMGTLYSALPKLDPVQARHLDVKFLKVFEGMLKLKMEMNKLSDDIIRASLSR